MRKQIVITIAAITFLVLGGIALGLGRMQGASAHAQTPAVQAQVSNQQGNPAQEAQENGSAVNGTEKDPPDPGETTGAAEDQEQDQNLPGGGHQDQGQADHQFEGTE